MYNVIDYLKNASVNYPEKIAIIEEDKKINYKDFNEYCKCGGTYLATKGYTLSLHDALPISNDKTAIVNLVIRDRKSVV